MPSIDTIWFVLIISFILLPFNTIAREECRSPSMFDSECNDAKVKVTEPGEIQLFNSEAIFRDYISSKKYNNRTLGEFINEVEVLGFTCGHPHRAVNTEWQCGRTVFRSDCSQEIQIMVVHTKFSDYLEQDDTQIIDEKFHLEDFPKYKKMRVMSILGSLAGTYLPKSSRCPDIPKRKNQLWE